MLLVPGARGSAPSLVKNQLKLMKVSRVRIAGGTGAVTSAMERSLVSGLGIAVTRYAGSNRYDTSVRIAADNFDSQTSNTVYFAYGLGFADALTGSAAAGARTAPILLVPGGCIPSGVYSVHDRLLPEATYVLGGPGVLADGVLHGNECAPSKPGDMNQMNWNGMNQAYQHLNRERFQAGVSGARLAGTSKGVPAYQWSRNMHANGYRQDAHAKKNNSWVRDGAIARNGLPLQLVRRMTENPAAKLAVLGQVRGKRLFVSVGYFEGKGNFLTIYTGFDAQ